MVSVTQTGACPVSWPYILAIAMCGRQKFLKQRAAFTVGMSKETCWKGGQGSHSYPVKISQDEESVLP